MTMHATHGVFCSGASHMDRRLPCSLKVIRTSNLLWIATNTVNDSVDLPVIPAVVRDHLESQVQAATS